MILFDEDRPSDSPVVERVWRCHSEGAAPFLSIAAIRCELVVSRLGGKVTMTVRGPETKATSLGDCPGNGEWLGILLKLGTFLPNSYRKADPSRCRFYTRQRLWNKSYYLHPINNKRRKRRA